MLCICICIRVWVWLENIRRFNIIINKCMRYYILYIYIYNIVSLLHMKLKIISTVRCSRVNIELHITVTIAAGRPYIIDIAIYVCMYVCKYTHTHTHIYIYIYI